MLRAWRALAEISPGSLPLRRGIGGKRLELLKETVPTFPCSGAVGSAEFRICATMERESTARPRTWLELHSMKLSSAEIFESAFQEAVRAGSDALTVTQNPLITSRRKQVMELVAKLGCRQCIHQGDFVESGGLMSYGDRSEDSYRRAAAMVDKILKGAKPADLPVEQADEVRAGDQSQSGKADRIKYSAVSLSQSG